MRGVSTGSLGARLPAADVAATEAFGPVNAVNGRVGTLPGKVEILAERSDVENAAAIGEKPVTVAASASVKNLYVAVGCCTVEAADFGAPLRLAGVSVGGHDHA